MMLLRSQATLLCCLGTLLLCDGNHIIRKTRDTRVFISAPGKVQSEASDSTSGRFRVVPNLIQHTQYVNNVPVLLTEEEGSVGANALLEGWVPTPHENKTWIVLLPSESIQAISNAAHEMKDQGLEAWECPHEKLIVATASWQDLKKLMKERSWPADAIVEQDAPVYVPEKMNDEPDEQSDGRPASMADTAGDGKSDGRPASYGLDRVDDRRGLDASYIDYPASQGAGVDVYVLDTGIRTTHREFGGRALAFHDLFTNGNPNRPISRGRRCDPHSLDCAWDRHGHGTHCAGTVAGDTVGVARKATVLSVKVLSDSGRGTNAEVLQGMEVVVNQAEETGRPSVMSMSLGGGKSRVFEQAVDSATRAGVTVVVAAGNNNADACLGSPAHVPKAITVGSTDRSDQMSGFSNYGGCIDIFAPGSFILSASSRSDTGHRSLSGTSMACPHVAGAVALVLAEEPDLSVQQVDERIKSRATYGVISRIPSRPFSVNALLYVGSAHGEPIPPTPPTPVPTFVEFEQRFSGRCQEYIQSESECVRAAAELRIGVNRVSPWRRASSAPSGCLYVFTTPALYFRDLATYPPSHVSCSTRYICLCRKPGVQRPVPTPAPQRPAPTPAPRNRLTCDDCLADGKTCLWTWDGQQTCNSKQGSACQTWQKYIAQKCVATPVPTPERTPTPTPAPQRPAPTPAPRNRLTCDDCLADGKTCLWTWDGQQTCNSKQGSECQTWQKYIAQKCIAIPVTPTPTPASSNRLTCEDCRADGKSCLWSWDGQQACDTKRGSRCLTWRQYIAESC